MKAFQVREIGKPAQLQEIERPTPADDEVLVEIAACGLNFADLLMEAGQYQETPPTPFTLGLEVAGTVQAIGQKARNVSIGDRVAVFAGSGGMADYGCFKDDRCLLLPEAMPFTDAAAFQVAYGTSHLALFHRARLRAGETLLVLGAAGGVGLTAIELAKAAGARVIAVARGREKLAVARKAGADHVLESGADDLAEQLRALGGADVVFDPVGGSSFKAALRATRREGRYIVIGFASGDIPRIPANILLVKNITVIGLYWGGYLEFAPQVLRESLEALLGMYRAGQLHPHISHTLPLERAEEAMALLRGRKSTGKVLVMPRPETPRP